MYCVPRAFVPSGGRAFWCKRACAFDPPPRPPLRGFDQTHAKKGEGGGVCDPRVFCASRLPYFLARWRVRGRPAVRGPAGTGSVGNGVGEGARCDTVHSQSSSNGSSARKRGRDSPHLQGSVRAPSESTPYS